MNENQKKEDLFKVSVDTFKPLKPGDLDEYGNPIDWDTSDPGWSEDPSLNENKQDNNNQNNQTQK